MTTDPLDRSRLRVLSVVNVAAGLWLMVASFTLRLPHVYPHELTFLTFLLTGTAVLTLAVLHALRWSQLRGASWGNLILGAWLAASPLIIGNTKYLSDAKTVGVVSVVTGVVIVAGAALALAASERQPRAG